MTQEVLDLLPGEIYQADSVVWEQTFSGYEADQGWDATAYIIPTTGTPVSIVGVANVSAFTFTLTVAVSEALAVGEYRWFVRAEQGDEAVTVYEGTTKVLPDPASSTGVDFRSHVKKMLDAIESALEGSASSSVLEYTIASGGGQRSLKNMSKQELRHERERYKALYIQEQNELRLKNGLGVDTNVHFQFKAPE